MLSNLWGRITGKDKQLQYPDQQAVFLGRVGDNIIVFPYGLYADLPAETLLKEIAPGVSVPVTVDRPTDTERGETTFFHPTTGTRVIMRNNGNVEVISKTSVTIDAPETAITGDVVIDGNLSVSGKDFITHTHTGSPTAATGPVTPTGTII